MGVAEELRGWRGEGPDHETRTSQDVQARAQCPTPEGLKAAVPEQDGKCRRGFADPRKGSRDSLSFSFHWICVNARGRRLVSQHRIVLSVAVCRF